MLLNLLSVITNSKAILLINSTKIMSLRCEIVSDSIDLDIPTSPVNFGVKEVEILSKENREKMYSLYNLDMVFNGQKEEDPRLKTCTKLSNAKQDFTTSGRYAHSKNPKESFSWIVVADGHGPNTAIDIIKKIDWSTFVKMNSVEKMNEHINQLMKQQLTSSSGSTLSIVKIYDDHFDCYYIGDSEIRIFMNKEVVFVSPAHNYTNALEMERIKTMKGVTVDKQERAMKVLDDGLITMYLGEEKYYRFSPLDRTNMTRTFGHDQRSLEFMEHTRVERKQDSSCNYKVVVASDGLWDITHENDDKFLNHPENDAEKIAEMAHKRWHQKWEFIPKYEVYLNTEDKEEQQALIRKDIEFPKHDGSIDDVAVATWIQ